MGSVNRIATALLLWRSFVLATAACIATVAGPHTIHAGVLQPGDILVVDGAGSVLGDGALIRVDPATGNRTLISGSGVGSGPLLSDPVGIAIESAGSVLVSHRYEDPVLGTTSERAIYRINATTGDRTVLSGPNHGTGPDFGDWEGPFGMVITPDGSLLVATITHDPFPENSGGAIFHVDRVTGDRSIVSGLGVGAGITLASPVGIAIDGVGAIIVSDPSRDAVIRIDPGTGNRHVVSGGPLNVGTGPVTSFPYGVALTANSMILLTDPIEGILFSIDQGSGDRTVLSSATVGLGPQFSPGGVALADDDRPLVINGFPESLLSVDPITGNRTVLSGAGIGSGPELINPSMLAIVPVPEPASFVLLVVACLTLMIRHRVGITSLTNRKYDARLEGFITSRAQGNGALIDKLMNG